MLGLSAIFLSSLLANDNGLALTPPLGWRSWNLFKAHVNQHLITGIMDAMVDTTRKVDGKPTSLKGLGYVHVGLDDGWQQCEAPSVAPSMHYHNSSGYPIVNLDLFPNMTKMTSYAHSLGLYAGWYGNNCICADHCQDEATCALQIKADVATLRSFNFDSVKLDGCGGELDLSLWNKELQASPGPPVLVENCHWGNPNLPFAFPNRSLPPAEGCPFNFYRSSGDIRPTWGSILWNLGTTHRLHDANLSYPGCWAYPDMLQVGVVDPQYGRLSHSEAVAHFCLWAIISSPLILSHNLTDPASVEVWWSLVANPEIIAVNQAYVGDSGGRYDYSLETTTLMVHMDEPQNYTEPILQYFYKPLGNHKVAVVLLNVGDEAKIMSAVLGDIGKKVGLPGAAKAFVRDILNRVDLGEVEGHYDVAVGGHSCAMVVLSLQ